MLYNNPPCFTQSVPTNHNQSLPLPTIPRPRFQSPITTDPCPSWSPPQAQCGNILSYGRRRRSLSEGGIVTLGGEYSLIGGEIQLEDDRDDPEDDHDTIYHEMPLQKEIIVDSETVKPLRAGLLPEETGMGFVCVWVRVFECACACVFGCLSVYVCVCSGV